jgi:hypothetical protein
MPYRYHAATLSTANPQPNSKRVSLRPYQPQAASGQQRPFPYPHPTITPAATNGRSTHPTRQKPKPHLAPGAPGENPDTLRPPSLNVSPTPYAKLPDRQLTAQDTTNGRSPPTLNKNSATKSAILKPRYLHRTTLHESRTPANGPQPLTVVSEAPGRYTPGYA